MRADLYQARDPTVSGNRGYRLLLSLRLHEVLPGKPAVVGVVPAACVEVCLLAAPGGGVKLIFASPTYGPIDPKAVVSQRNAIMHAAANGVTWLGDASPDRMGWDGARNAVVESVLKAETEEVEDKINADAIFWCDSDIILPAHAVTSLVLAGKEFVTGLYFQRKPPFPPQIYIYDARGGKDGKGTFRGLVQWPDNVVAPIDAAGFGCILTSVAMLRKIAPPHFDWKRFGEDFTFCLNAKEAGYQLYVHTGVLCGHLADPVPVTIDTFREAWKDWKMSPVEGSIAV